MRAHINYVPYMNNLDHINVENEINLLVNQDTKGTNHHHQSLFLCLRKIYILPIKVVPVLVHTYLEILSGLCLRPYSL